jgi:hypothetical protein
VGWSDEVESGFRLALVILTVVVTLILLMTGLYVVFLGPPAYRVRGSAMLFVAGTVVILTVRWWAKWFFAACGLNALKSLIVGVFGTLSTHGVGASRSLYFGWAMTLGLMAFLSYRFTDQRPNWLDSICLVGALFAVCFSLLSPEYLWWMLIGSLSLGIAFAYEHLRRTRASARVS